MSKYCHSTFWGMKHLKRKNRELHSKSGGILVQLEPEKSKAWYEPVQYSDIIRPG